MKVLIVIPKPIIDSCKSKGLKGKQITNVYQKFVNHCVSNYFGDVTELFENWYNEEIAN